MSILFTLLFLLSLLLIPIALIKPSILSKQNIPTRKKAFFITFGITIVLLILAIGTAPSSINKQVAGESITASATPQITTEQQITVPVASTALLPTPEPTATPSASPSIKPSAKPTTKPTVKPTAKPVVTIQPTMAPTSQTNANDEAKYYTNSAGNTVQSPTQSDSIPAGASAQCKDGSYSFSQSRRGTCSGHGGVAQWL